jgi:outer membrane protein insertion porin family
MGPGRAALWYFLAIAAAFLCAPLLGQEPPRRLPIRKITVEGLKRTSESEILGRMRIRLGDIYDEEQASRESGRLYAVGKFRQVKGPLVRDYADGVEVRFVVEEKPIVRRIEFRGRKSLSEADLVKSPPELSIKENALYNRHLVDQDVRTIRDKYLAQGFLFVDVSFDVKETPAEVDVTFVIREGTKVRIEEVRFDGNRSISSSDILGILDTRERDFWFFGLLRPGIYDPQLLGGDVLKVMQYYRRFGFLDVQAEAEDIALNAAKDRLTITFRIQEGPQFVFRGYRFSGNSVFSDQVLRDLTTAPVGKPFNAERMERDRQAIVDYYGNRAYIFVEVEPEFVPSPTSPEVHIKFTITENYQIYIERVRIRGNIKTRDRVIRRELEMFPGELVDNSKLVKSRSNLARLRIFRDIRYSYEDTSSPSSRNLVVSVDEETSGQLQFGFGVTSGFGLIGNLQITKRNFDITDWPRSIYEIADSFTGAGQTLNLLAQPGTRRSLFRLTFIEPYLFETRNSLALSVAKLDLIREDWDEDRVSFAPRLGHRFDFDRDLEFSLGLRLEEVEIKDIEDDAPPLVFQSRGFTSVVALNAGMNYDKRLYEPFEGTYDGHEERVFYEYAGGVVGGDVSFHKVELSSDLYFPLYVQKEGNLHHVIAILNRYGLIKPHDPDDVVPIFERFFLGGANDVRGFKFRGLGPHQRNEPIGGTARLYGTAEYSFPIFHKFVRGVAFFDYGNLSDLTDFKLERMRYSVGGGIRINFPFLGFPIPISLYFGTPLQKEDEDDARLFLFTIGTPF